MLSLSINIARLWRDIEALATFSAGSGPGVTRLTFSKEDRAARDYLRRQMESAGLHVVEIPPGIMLGQLVFPQSSGPPVMSGSHIDTVLSGGRFDGIVGVVGALEVARVLSENRVPLRSPYELVIYPEEEGTRFGAVLTGSKAWAGQLSLDQLEAMRDAQGISYVEAMEQWGLKGEEVHAHLFRRGRAKALLELHIEQSVVLEQRGRQIGAVTKIIGIRGFDVTLTGTANHAGATPMRLRKDALAGAANIMLELERITPTLGSHTVCTVGQISCTPGARNVIPGEVRFSVDFRDVEDLDGKWSQVAPCIREIAERRGLAVNVVEKASTEPVELSSSIEDLVEQVAKQRGLSCMRMPSGAVHDAQVLAPLTDTGMIFVPSRDGRSHCPEEYTEPSQIERGVNVLLDAVLALAA